MFLNDLITIMNNNLSFLAEQRTRFSNQGLLNEVLNIDKEILDTQLILLKLTRVEV